MLAILIYFRTFLISAFTKSSSFFKIFCTRGVHLHYLHPLSSVPVFMYQVRRFYQLICYKDFCSAIYFQLITFSLVTKGMPLNKVQIKSLYYYIFNTWPLCQFSFKDVKKFKILLSYFFWQNVGVDNYYYLAKASIIITYIITVL